MVGFLIPIPGKVVDGALEKGSTLYKSYKKDPAPTDLSAQQQDNKPVPPPPRNGWGSGSGSSSLPPPPGRGGGGARPGAAFTPSRASGPPPRVAAAASGPADMGTFGTQLLSHVLDSINLLESMGHITPQAARSAAAALDGSGASGHNAPNDYQPPTPTFAASRAPPKPAPAAPAAPAQVRATALWAYGQSGDPEDLIFSECDTIIIDEEVNDEWYRGRTIPAGRTAPLPKSGIFPSSYVEKQ